MERIRDGYATLLRDGEPVTGVELAGSYRARRRGLLGRDGIEGAILLSPASAVHTIRMRFPIDVAYLGKDMRVLVVVGMPPGRVGMPRVRARHILEAERGAFDTWGVEVGSRLTLD